jgi:putative redox protein
MSDKHIITTEWKGGLAFDADLGSHVIRMDAPKDAGGEGTGPGPKKHLLAALSGCTGMDVVSILGKMRVEIEGVSIEVQGDVADEHPKRYLKMHVIYTFKGKNLPQDKLEKAVKMSEETYCGVRATLAPGVELSSEIRTVEA